MATYEYDETVKTFDGKTVTVIEQIDNTVYVYDGRNLLRYHVSKISR